MNDRTDASRPGMLSLVSLALVWTASLAAWPWAPERITTHWNLYGEADGWMDRAPALFLMPSVITLLVALFLVLPRIDPIGRNYRAFAPVYRHLQSAIVIFMAIMHLLVLASALGWPIDMPRATTILVGLLFLILGNVMGKVRPNWFVGVRTPWTLSSPDVWTKTHRFAGHLMVVSGIAMVVAGALLPSYIHGMVVLGSAISLGLGSVGYSYWAWRRLQNGQSMQSGEDAGQPL